MEVTYRKAVKDDADLLIEIYNSSFYDDRFLVKPTKSAKNMMPGADMELPYEGAKEMLLVDDIDNKEFLKSLFESMFDELPAPKKKK